jgi:hypothetical protein
VARPLPSLGSLHPSRQHTLVRGPYAGFSPDRSTPLPSTQRSHPKPWPPPAPQLPDPPHGTRVAPSLSSDLANVWNSSPQAKHCVKTEREYHREQMIDQDGRCILSVRARTLWTEVAKLPLLQRTSRGPYRASWQPMGSPGEDLHSRLLALPVQERSEPRRPAAPICCKFPSLEGGYRGLFDPPTLAPAAASRPSPTLRRGYRTLGGPPRVDA